MARIQQDKFRIFISHKHVDSSIARKVASRLETLTARNKKGFQIECWVSGEDILGGEDWRKKIRQGLSESHLLLLLFTTPAHTWDWCLYEVGLFMRYDVQDASAVVCLFDPKSKPPGPLTNVQGVRANAREIREKLLAPLCKDTWRVTDDWLRGNLYERVSSDELGRASRAIAREFGRALGRSVYHPCHRVVLDFAHIGGDVRAGIPADAVVVEGPDGTSGFTMSLFQKAGGPARWTWSDLTGAVHPGRGDWLADLDQVYHLAVTERLWPPVKSTFNAWDPETKSEREYRIVIYEIVRSGDRPVGATLLLDRVA